MLGAEGHTPRVRSCKLPPACVTRTYFLPGISARPYVSTSKKSSGGKHGRRISKGHAVDRLSHSLEFPHVARALRHHTVACAGRQNPAALPLDYSRKTFCPTDLGGIYVFSVLLRV